MTNAVAFNVDLWKQGWKPVTRDGREVKGLSLNLIRGYLSGRVDDRERSWYASGKYYITMDYELDLLLLPPDPEIVVEVSYLQEGKEYTFIQEIFNASKVTAGKYKLVKID